MTKGLFILATLFFLLLLPGCSEDGNLMQDGYYSARSASFDKDGWRPFVTLYVRDNRIITVEWNAYNLSGLSLTWDVPYLRKLEKQAGRHPHRIIREYSQELLDRQSARFLRQAPGDFYFYQTFVRLASAAITQAKTGDRTVVEIPLSDPMFPQ